MHPHLAQIRSLPYHQFLGIELAEPSSGRSRVSLVVSERTANPMGVLHGGVISSLLDVAAYAALVSGLSEREAAVTHDLHVSFMRPARLGSEVVFEGEIVRRGRALAFIDARALVAGQLIASARVTKSIIQLGEP